jgi:tRNA(adenine34) deaminase
MVSQASPVIKDAQMSTPTDEDLRYMRRAIELAHIATEISGASPIGCVIVRDGQIIGEGHNEVDIRHDPTAHAEIVTMQRVGQALGSADFRGATLYSTLQPCGMCSMASIWGRIGRIVYGAGREHVHRMYFEDRHLDAFDFIADAFRDDLVMIGGVLAEECAALYYGPNDDPPVEVQGNI